ncbi:MAG TPA: nuclear transport factor 2 family protein [Sphingobium sp.]|nr:nuclear transport factor 2 family protein [Sphingobium sp.]
MTLDEMLAREAIRETMAAYTIAGDRLREEDFIAVFTEDAVLESEGVAEADLFRYEGKAAIRQWIARWRNPPEGAARTHQASFVRHHLTTSRIELTGQDNARARTYWVAWTDMGPDHAGYYLDDFRKVEDRWLLAHRRIRLDWQSPDSLFTTAITNTR